MELFFTFCSPNVAMMTAAVFLLMQKIRIRRQTIVRLLANMTKCGFGIYIVHYFLVGPFFLLIGPSSLPIPLQVPVMAVCIFAVAWAFTALVYKLLGKRPLTSWDSPAAGAVPTSRRAASFSECSPPVRWKAGQSDACALRSRRRQ